MIFPIEVWEKIFQFLDAVTLTNFKKVCKLWNFSIERLLQEKDFWYRLCQKRIPQVEWSMLLEKLYPNQFYTDLRSIEKDPEKWMSLYRFWIKCRRLPKYDPVAGYFKPLPQHRETERITCAAISQEILAVGSTHGYVYFYDLLHLSRLPLYTADHLNHVSDIQFMRYGSKLIAASLSLNNHVKFWDIGTKKLVYEMRGKQMCASYGYCFIVIKNLLTIVEECVPKALEEFDVDDIVALSATCNKLTLYTAEGHYVDVTVQEEARVATEITSFNPLQGRTRKYYMFKANVGACITDCGMLGLLTKGEWNIYNVFSTLHGVPTAVFIYVGILIIGLDSGNIHICYLEDVERHHNFDSENSKTITLDRGPIVSLDITTCNEDAYLMAACGNTVHILEMC